jgi:hypothetical protein
MLIEQGSEASPAAEADVTVDSSSAAEVSAEASTQTENEARPSLLDVVRSVVEPQDQAAEESSAPAAEKAESAAEGEGETAPAEEPDNFDGLAFGKHPRFKQILDQRNTARTRIKELETQVGEVERLKAPAEQYERIEAFMQQNGLTGQEVVDLYKFGALWKSDPEKALEHIQPYLADLYTRTGRILPDDLSTEVDGGQITEARARELARERARTAELERRASEATERATTVEETTAQDRTQRELAAKLTDWEADKKAKDPDYAAKEDLIADRCAALIQQKGHPTNAAEMVALLDQAHADVSERMRKLMPPRPATRKAPTSGSSTHAQPQPKSFRQALELAAARGN